MGRTLEDGTESKTPVRWLAKVTPGNHGVNWMTLNKLLMELHLRDTLRIKKTLPEGGRT